jgi:hypothetical protein
VVDRMAADAPIEVALPAAGISLRSYWPDIAPSPGAADPSVALAGPPAVEAAAPRPAQEPIAQTPTEPPPPPKPPPPSPEPPPEPIPPPQPDPQPIRVEPPVPEPAPQPPRRPDPGSRRWLPLALGLLALLLIVGGAWQLGLLPWPASDQEPVSDGEVAPEPPAPQPEPTVPAPQPEPARDWRAELLDYVNGGDPAAERLFELGQGAAGAGDLETALLAYEEAMRQGHGPALMAIGRWYDPAHYSANSSPFSQPNPEQAAGYYQRAGEAGMPEAAEALRDLCASEPDAGWTEQSCPPPSGD